MASHSWLRIPPWSALQSPFDVWLALQSLIEARRSDQLYRVRPTIFLSDECLLTVWSYLFSSMQFWWSIGFLGYQNWRSQPPCPQCKAPRAKFTLADLKFGYCFLILECLYTISWDTQTLDVAKVPLVRLL